MCTPLSRRAHPLARAANVMCRVELGVANRAHDREKATFESRAKRGYEQLNRFTPALCWPMRWTSMMQQRRSPRHQGAQYRATG